MVHLDLKMYLELHKRGIRDVLDMNCMLRNHFRFLINGNIDEKDMEGMMHHRAGTGCGGSIDGKQWGHL